MGGSRGRQGVWTPVPEKSVEPLLTKVSWSVHSMFKIDIWTVKLHSGEQVPVMGSFGLHKLSSFLAAPDYQDQTKLKLGRFHKSVKIY